LGGWKVDTSAALERSWRSAVSGIDRLGKDFVDQLLYAGPLDQFDCRNLDSKRCFQSVNKRHRHERVESEFAKRPGDMDRFRDA
jgi:hypothetical protein